MSGNIAWQINIQVHSDKLYLTGEVDYNNNIVHTVILVFTNGTQVLLRFSEIVKRLLQNFKKEIHHHVEIIVVKRILLCKRVFIVKKSI